MKKQFMIFYFVKLGFSRLTPLKKVSKTKFIKGKMTGNASFPAPIPALADVDKAADDLQTAQDALDGTKIKTEERNAAEATLSGLVKQLQSYVDVTANGNKEMILSSGMDFRNPASKSEKKGPVEGLTVEPTKVRGEIFIKWKPIAQSGVKKISVSYDLAEWHLLGETTKSKVTLSNLTSGGVAYVRVACVTAAGSGPWSDIVTCYVL